MSTKLSEDLLERLLHLWREQDAAIAHGQLRPGLTTDEMDRLVEPLGIALPPEARVWWGWHDGATPSARAGEVTVNGWTYQPLGEAVERTVKERDWARRDGTSVADRRWAEPRDRGAGWADGLLHWLKDIGGDQLAIDCNDPGDVSPVYYLDKVERDDSEPYAGSIGDAIQQMIDGIECGAVTFDRETKIWRADEALLRERLPHASLLR